MSKKNFVENWRIHKSDVTWSRQMWFFFFEGTAPTPAKLYKLLDILLIICLDRYRVSFCIFSLYNYRNEKIKETFHDVIRCTINYIEDIIWKKLEDHEALLMREPSQMILSVRVYLLSISRGHSEYRNPKGVFPQTQLLLRYCIFRVLK